MPNGPTIVFAEDDQRVRESVQRGLRLEGYDVVAVTNGQEAVDAVLRDPPSLVVLDVMMPVLDGLTACRQLRTANPGIPILMLTARHGVSDRIAGLDAGADDYLVKPFALGELSARVRALLRRSSISGAEQQLRVADLTLDPNARHAKRAGVDLVLTKTEFDLLELLMFNAGTVLSRDTLYDRIWGIDFDTGSRALDVHITYLRQKTEVSGSPRVVETVRGVGYVIRR